MSLLIDALTSLAEETVRNIFSRSEKKFLLIYRLICQF